MPDPAGTAPFSLPSSDAPPGDRVPKKAPDPTKLTADTRAKYQRWKGYRQPHEGTWFVTAAMLRGQQHVIYDQTTAQLTQPDAPSYAVRLDVNKMLPKHRARMAKFFKNRPKPLVVPASLDQQDLLDARATECMLQYQWQRLRLESAYRDVRQWASIGSKAYWWLGYDPEVIGRVKMTDEMTGEDITEPAMLGDVTLEVGSAWEVVVKDPNIARIGQQPEIIRARSIPKGEAERRFKTFKADKSSGGERGIANKQLEDRIGSLIAGEQDGGISPIRDDEVLLMEHYMAPGGEYPHGCVVTICGDTLVKYEEELPFGFWDSPTNPYPCVEFSDTGHVGQFWNTTWLEQLIPLQRMFNRLLEMITENAEAVGRPKIIIYKQHNLPDGAWTSAAGEVVELTWVPGLPPPIILQPQSVAGDLWNMLNLLIRQFDDISQIHTASEGGGSGQESGYQTSLLQEATDVVHAPDIRGDELSIEDAAWKIRRIVQQTWDVPRLIAVGGDSSMEEMLEFSQRQINDAAEVRIQIGSMLPDLKAAKAQITLNYFKEGLLGDPNDPMVKRKALALMDLTGYGSIDAEDRRDEDQARRENQLLMDGKFKGPAQFFHQHIVHIHTHESRMKTTEYEMLPSELKVEFIAHLITHYDFVSLPVAMGLRQQYGLQAMPIAAPPKPNMGGSPPSPGGPMDGPPPPSGADMGGPPPPAPPSGAPAPAPSGIPA